MSGLTPTELRLVERYVWVLDLMSRCAQGLDHGDWYYLADKAGDLERRAAAFAEVAAEIAHAVRDGHRGPRVKARPRCGLLRQDGTNRVIPDKAFAD